MAAFDRLIPQLLVVLAAAWPRRTRGDRRQPDSALFVARVDGAVVGSLTLALYRIPTALKAWIEDVVVDDAARGRGVGEALNRAALDEARRRGAKDVSLTSRPSREAANRLYRRIGFEARDQRLPLHALRRGGGGSRAVMSSAA